VVLLLVLEWICSGLTRCVLVCQELEFGLARSNSLDMCLVWMGVHSLRMVLRLRIR
jgi:hypothetical protein